MNIIDFTYINFKSGKNPTSLTTGEDLIKELNTSYNNTKLNQINIYIWNDTTQRTYKHKIYTKETTTHIHIIDALYYLHASTRNNAIPIIQTLHQHMAMLTRKLTHLHYNAKTFNNMIATGENAKKTFHLIISFYNNNNYMSMYDIFENTELNYVLNLN